MVCDVTIYKQNRNHNQKSSSIFWEIWHIHLKMQTENKGSERAAWSLEKMAQEGESVLADIKTHYKTIILVF